MEQEELAYDQPALAARVAASLAQLNADQRSVFDAVMAACGQSNDVQVWFLLFRARCAWLHHPDGNITHFSFLLRALACSL